MSSKDIAIIEDTGQPHECDYVYVNTYTSPADGVTRLAIVEATHWCDAMTMPPRGGTRTVQLVNMQPCAHEEALATARDYAQRHAIQRIYVKTS